MARGTLHIRPRKPRLGGKNSGVGRPGHRRKFNASRYSQSGWARVVKDIRKASWTAKLLTVGMAIIVLYPLFDAVDSAIPHHAELRGNLWVCDLKTLSNFDFDQVNGKTEDIPKEFRDLDGKRVQVTGQMWAPFRADGRVHDFDLVYSIASCCFSGPPRLQHIVKAKAPQGVTFPYSAGRVVVTGTLHVGVQRDGEVIDSIYRMDVESVRPE